MYPYPPMRRKYAFILAFLALLTGARPSYGLTVAAGSYESVVPEDVAEAFFTVRSRMIAKSGTRAEIENIRHCEIPPLCGDVFLSRRTRETTRVVSDRHTDPAAIGRYLDSVAEAIRKDPKDAVFGESDSHQVIPISPSEYGIELDKPNAILSVRDTIESGLERAVLPVRTSEPEIADGDSDRLGIRELIAEGTTDFTGSTETRIHNIRRALEQYQGLLIAPGEEFSFVGHLGEVDGDHGYLPELVIKHDRTEPDFGGGICQVSSTLFRTAINAGLKITARKNHAYPVHYYRPYGMDATVYVPAPDLRFVNNTPGHLLIVSEIIGRKLTFRLYGTKDGRTVDVDGPRILESNPDGSMKTTFSQTVRSASGETVIADDFPSNYKSPDLFPKPEEALTEKPDNWSKRQWEEYLAKRETT